jgi:hypothetical protein
METPQATQTEAEKPAPPPCTEKGCTKPTAFGKAPPYGHRCREHVPHVDSIYTLEQVLVVLMTCGECGSGTRLEGPVVGRAKVKKPIHDVLCQACGHLMDGKPEGSLITDVSPGLVNALNRGPKRR